MTRLVGQGAVLGSILALAAAPAACSTFSATASDDTPDAMTAESGATDGGTVTGAKRRLYLFGGEQIVQLQPKRAVTTALSAPIADDGSLGPWEHELALDVDRSAAASTVVDGVAMFFGGASGGAAATATAQRATLGAAAQGSGSAWTQLPLFKLGRSNASAVGANGAVYLTGGTTDKNVRSAELDRYDIANGLWTTPQSGLKEALAGHATLFHGGRLYVIGGEKLGAAGASQETSAAQLLDDGTLAGWGSFGVLPIGVAYHGLVHVEPWVFTIGGSKGATGATVTSVQRAEFDAAGNLAWLKVDDVPVPSGQTGIADACVVTDGRTFYVIGGRKDATSASLLHVSIGRVDAMGVVTWADGPVLPEGRAAAGCAISPSSAP